MRTFTVHFAKTHRTCRSTILMCEGSIRPLMLESLLRQEAHRAQVEVRVTASGRGRSANRAQELLVVLGVFFAGVAMLPVRSQIASQILKSIVLCV